MNPPPDKKRRTAGSDDNLWDDDDDDLMLTQENIDTLMQSQVIGSASDGKINAGTDVNLHTPLAAIRTVGRGTAKSRSSNDMPLQQPCTASDGRHIFIHDGTAETSATGDIAQLKAENMKLQKQLNDMQMTTHGRIKILQDKLAQRESEIQKIRQERMDQQNQAAKDQTNIDKSWQDKLEKLKSELQFTKHELNEAIQKQSSCISKAVQPKPNAVKSGSSISKGYDFSGDFISMQKQNTSKPQKDAMLQVSLAGVSSKPSVPVPSFKLNVKRPKGHVSGSYLVHKVLQLQFPLNQPSQKPGSSGSAVADTANKSDLESGQTSLETISSSYMSTDSSALSSAYMRLQQANALLMRTISCLHQSNTSSPQDNDLLQSDTESATLLLPTVAESINTYTSVLSSLQFSMLSHSGSISSTADSSPSVETLTSSDSSLPRGFSARYIQVMGHQVHTALHILKTLVTYSIPVRRMLIQQVCSELATGLSQTEGSPDNSIKEICGCCLLKKLCHLANHKLYDNINSNLQLCVLTLDILTTTLQCCPANHLERILDNLPICDVILACISEDVEDVTNRFQLGFSVLRLIHTLVRSERVIRMMCTKTVDCIFYNVYSFCVQSLTDQPENRSIVHETKFVQILASILTHDRATSSVLVSIDCHCGEVANQLLSVLHHLYLSGVYHDSPRALALLHQGSSVFQNMASVDKEFVPNHENNYQYVELVYGMDNLYKTLLDGTEPVTQDLLLELRQDYSGDEEDMDESHELSTDIHPPDPDTPTTSSAMAHDTDVFLPDPDGHSTPIQSRTENRMRRMDESDTIVQSRQGKKLKLSINKKS